MVPSLCSVLQEYVLPQLMLTRMKKMPQRPSPCHGTPSMGKFWGAQVLTGVLGLLPTKTDGSGKPSEFRSALEITHHCQKKGLLLANLGRFMILGGNQCEL